MPWESIARCDVCRAIKGDANKWLIADQRKTLFQIIHWNYDIAKGSNVKLVCSESCLHKLMQPFLDSRTTPSTIISLNEVTPNANATTTTNNSSDPLDPLVTSDGMHSVRADFDQLR